MNWIRRNWLWAVGLAACAGCWTTKPDIKPPKHPEEYVLPPVTETRFSAPPNYPKEASKELGPKKGLDQPGMPPAGGSRFGAGPGGAGMRGY
jgi:hypothetical protein